MNMREIQNVGYKIPILRLTQKLHFIGSKIKSRHVSRERLKTRR